jgi:acetyl esterase
MSDQFRNLEPTTRLFLETLAAKNDPPLSQVSLAEARASLSTAQAGHTVNLATESQDDVLPTGPTGKIAIRIVRPRGKISALPVVMFFHGGGWVLGDKDSHDRLVREIAMGAEAAVIVVDFDRSPEARFPIAIEEAYAAMKYVAEHAGEWNLDASRIAVVGDSAGGNMATVVSMLARDRGAPNIALQVLFYPTTDANFDTSSYRQFAEGYFLGKEDMKWFWDQYLPEESARSIPTASPLQASVEHLRGLPPAVIFTGEFDVLRDEGEAYAHNLIDAGVTVTAIRALGTIHGFVTLNALATTPAAKAAMVLANESLRNAFIAGRRTYENVA